MSNMLKAVGITKDGLLMPIRSVDGIRGVALIGIIVSAGHVDWFRGNEEIIRAAFAMNSDQGVVTLLDGGKKGGTI